ncbi:hypothetical protein [Actinoallomurus acanthiterrae]
MQDRSAITRCCDHPPPKADLNSGRTNTPEAGVGVTRRRASTAANEDNATPHP